MVNPKKDTVKPEVLTPTPEELETQRQAEAKSQQEADENARLAAEAKALKEAAMAAKEKARQQAEAAVAKEQAQKAEKARIAAEKKVRKEADEKALLDADPLLVEGHALLAAYPHRKEVYMTTDGFGYFHEADAVNHAAALGDKIVRRVIRKDNGQE